MHLYTRNNISYGQSGRAFKFFTFTGFKKHLRIAHSDFNLSNTVCYVTSENNISISYKNKDNNNVCCKNENNNINICCKNENACKNTLQDNCEMDATPISQTSTTNSTTNEVNSSDLILTSAKLKNIACNFASQLTGLDLTENTLDSVINVSTELITMIINSVNVFLRSGQVQ